MTSAPPAPPEHPAGGAGPLCPACVAELDRVLTPGQQPPVNRMSHLSEEPPAMTRARADAYWRQVGDYMDYVTRTCRAEHEGAA